MTVLDKSRSDWKDFKTTNEELEEELETYKKSSNTVRRARAAGGVVCMCARACVGVLRWKVRDVRGLGGSTDTILHRRGIAAFK